ncbi:hypothetical protein [Bacillus cereus group sp. BfR-BA-01309]|uniref:hypothetical protein n=1 Tax=Bacillus cereus group sp. BfR-BA-01309 TaxID=2920286 RepID=UPI001F576768|nr:hypothetical protein [Bacillus cereus group sp. BfR-BA-01309]
MGRSAFNFSRQASILFKVATKKTISKTNLALLAIDTAVSLIEAGCACLNYNEAKKQTIEIKKQVNKKNKLIDGEVKEKEKQIESEFNLMVEEMFKELNEKRRTLQLNAEKIRNDMTIGLKKDVQGSKKWLNKLDLQQLAIDPIKETLALYDKFIQLSDTGSHKQFLELEEQHRICLQKYTELRTKFI